MPKTIKFKASKRFTKNIEKLNQIHQQFTEKQDFRFKELLELEETIYHIGRYLDGFREKVAWSYNPYVDYDKNGNIIPIKEYR